MFLFIFKYGYNKMIVFKEIDIFKKKFLYMCVCAGFKFLILILFLELEDIIV